MSHAAALAHLAAGRHEEAMHWIDRSLREQPRWVRAIRLKIALCGHLDRVEEGREWLQLLREVSPGWTVARSAAYPARFLAADIIGLTTEGLRKSGLPEA